MQNLSEKGTVVGTHIPTVVIIGAGFGGLYAARELVNKPVRILLIDRNNYHLFTPLLYQVATCGLETGEISYPIRGIFRSARNFDFLLGEVVSIDAQEQTIKLQTIDGERSESYDYLIVAAGSVTNTFNTPGVDQLGYNLKELGDAVRLRNHILTLFERAVWVDDPEVRKALTTIVVVGGGPTGLETAGAIHELYGHVLRKEFPALAPRVILIEATDRVLIPFPEALQESACRQLASLGVEVMLGNPVVETTADHVRLKDGQIIPTHTLIWAAGVKASPLATSLGLPLQRGGRVQVRPTLAAEGCDRVYVVGDIAYLEDPQGKPYPMLIPVAKQQGILAARNILRRLAGKEQETFRYVDRGIMATIGRSRAVAWIFNRVQLSGYLAWLAWLGLHLVTLLGFRNRLVVLLNWLWNYITYDRSVRIIINPDSIDSPEPLKTAPVGNAEREPSPLPRW